MHLFGVHAPINHAPGVCCCRQACLHGAPLCTQALHTAFVGLDAECRQRFARSGTTATVAVAVGWEVVIANVGDSVAYLDTGDQVVKVSGDHRLENNAEEVARVLVAGGEWAFGGRWGAVWREAPQMAVAAPAAAKLLLVHPGRVCPASAPAA